MNKPRKISDTEILARKFVREILNEEWDYRTGTRHMRDAKNIINPAPDPVTGEKPIAYTIDDAMECVKALQAGKITGNPVIVKSLAQVWWGTPPNIIKYLTPPPRPPVYDSVRYDEWFKKYAKRAIRFGWCGIYARLDEDLEGLTIAQLNEIDPDLAKRSLIAFMRSKK